MAGQGTNVFAGTAAPHQPRSARGGRTRAALVRAAREVIERDGYLAARVADIADTAGVAVGTFYTHFRTKEEVFAAVIAELSEEVLHPGHRETVDAGDPVASIEAANRTYLQAYRRNARLMAQLDQAAHVNDDLLAVRLARGRVFTERNARGIRRLQERGLADPGLDPTSAASALGGMVSRMAKSVFVHGQELDFEDLVDLTTRLYCNALGVPYRDPAPQDPDKQEEQWTSQRPTASSP